MIYYLIRHKETQQYMPQMKRGRGYTSWNPLGKLEENKVFAALSTPRLIETEEKAKRIISVWAYMPNGYVKHSWDGDDGIDIKPDNRKREDLEIVKVNLKIKGPNDPFWSNLLMK